MQTYNNWAPKIGLQGGMTTQKFLETANAEINSTFSSSGFWGLQILASAEKHVPLPP